MTDTNRSLSELPALLAERRRYEGWLVALDARRDTTPEHVFERVQADYKTRLARVSEQLEAHRHIVDEERANVNSRLSLLEAEERMRRDERAELELRSHVGELVGDEASAAFKTVDTAIDQLLGEKRVLQTRLDELAALFDEPAAQSRPSGEQTRASSEVTAPVGIAAAPSRRDPAREPAPAPPPPASAPSARTSSAAPQAADSSFDELAFLNTVVGAGDVSQTLVAKGKRDASLVREERAPEPLLSGIADGKGGSPANEAPLAANVSANMPITLRATANEQTKTLKCNECGGMNYPTEWYCERCGAELAAL